MNSWKVENPNRLLKEVKNKFLGCYNTKDLRWSIEHNRCFVNKYVERFCGAQVKKGDLISIWIEKCPSFNQEKERILFEDPHILVYDKPSFLTSENLAQLTHTFLSHRLDRDTSGVILLAKNKESLAGLESQFYRRIIHKEYMALVEGKTKDEGNISGNMALLHKREGAVIWGISRNNGLWSQTHWKLLHHYNRCSLLQCFPLTGRTHQIRVHLNHIGHPIVGDYTYGSKCQKNTIFRPLLHSSSLSFSHPITHQPIICTTPLPPDFNISDSMQ